jgi:hypothetical protein
MTGRRLWPFVLARAACSNSRLNPDDWYPVSVPVAAARREAAAAIAVCAACPVRGEYLELALRNWAIGQFGVWGRTVPSRTGKAMRRAGHSARPCAAQKSGRWTGGVVTAAGQSRDAGRPGAAVSEGTPAAVQHEPELAGQTVAVIGGSAGIGLETPRRAQAEGAEVILTGRDPVRLSQAAKEVGAQRTAAFDANDTASLQRFFQDLPAPIDHVMVTAGGPVYGPLLEMDPAQVRTALSDHIVLGLEVAERLPLRRACRGEPVRRDPVVTAALFVVTIFAAAALAVALFKPAGPQGPRGPQGPQGVQGVPGSQGSVPAYPDVCSLDFPTGWGYWGCTPNQDGQP